MKIKFNKKVLIIVIGVIVIMSLLGLGVLSSYREIKEEKCFTMEEINEIQVTTLALHKIIDRLSRRILLWYTA